MPKKKRNKQIFESMKIESVEANAESKESEKVQDESALSDSIQQEAAAELPENDEQLAEEESVPSLKEEPVVLDEPATVEEESSADDLLADVRQSLIEDETVKEEKKSKRWWRRAAKSLQKDKQTEAETPVTAEPELPAMNVQVDSPVETAEEKPEEEVDPIDELIDLLEAEADEKVVEKPVVVEAPPEPEPEVDIEELKKQAFRPRGEGESEEQESLTEVRSVALEDGEEVFVEVQATRQDPLEERLTALENALRPYRRYVYFGFAVLGIVMAVIAGSVLFNIYQQSRPVPTVNPNLPFPTSMSLPGGLNFTLGKGTLNDGQWNPQGPEWLEGTEVCRWVAIPWSRQLEAVIRTLNPDDQIELVMSNNDRLLYKVYSVQQLSNEQLQELPSDSPCLLLVLAKADSETRWVLTALP